MQVEGRADDAVGDGFALGHGFLGVLEHVEEKFLVGKVLLRRDADVVHGDERVERVLAHGALCVEQEPVGPIDDRRVDVRHFGAKGEGVEDHRVEELGGEDHGLGLVVAELDDVLLDPADLLDWKDGAQLAPWDQDGVTDFQDLVDVVDRVLVFKLGHDANVGVFAQFVAKLFRFLLHHFLQLNQFHVIVVDGVNDIVDIILKHKANIFSQGRIVIFFVVIVCSGISFIDNLFAL